jgi:hypothetical protein
LGTGGPIVSGITTFSNVNYFVPPRGTTAERPSNCPSGSIRFNTDSAHLEYFDGLQWLEMEAFNNELGVSGALGNRGVFGGGYTPTATNTIDYITISTLGNAQDFGDLTTARSGNAACSSSTRGLFAGGNTPPGVFTDAIYFLTFSSTGNTSSFGTLTAGTTRYIQGCSNATRGLFGGGQGPGYSYRNNIEYVTIASAGNSVDFGDLMNAANLAASLASSTRGIWTGGYNNPSANLINYVTISTTGNAVYFGDLSALRYGVSGCSNATRGIFGGGTYPSPVGVQNVIDYITIASTGNAQDFGDLTVKRFGNASCSSPIRGVWAGGYNPATPTNADNTIDYVTIASTGNAIDFGDLPTFSIRGYFAGCSNGHGGL